LSRVGARRGSGARDGRTLRNRPFYECRQVDGLLRNASAAAATTTTHPATTIGMALSFWKPVVIPSNVAMTMSSARLPTMTAKRNACFLLTRFFPGQAQANPIRRDGAAVIKLTAPAAAATEPAKLSPPVNGAAAADAAPPATNPVTAAPRLIAPRTLDAVEAPRLHFRPVGSEALIGLQPAYAYGLLSCPLGSNWVKRP
jgi:hypothetical protein